MHPDLGLKGRGLTYHFVLAFLFLSLEPEKLSKQKIATTPLFLLLALRFLFGVTEQGCSFLGKGRWSAKSVNDKK
jgi:hypothetical protein